MENADDAMTRILALVAGLVLIACPVWSLREITVPPPEFRAGSYADFLLHGQALLAIYGSVLLGIAVHWVRANRSGQTLAPFGLFKAGMQGVVAGSIVFFGGGIVYGLAKYGAFEKALLWGMLVIFWADLGRNRIGWLRLAILCLAWSGGTNRRDAGKQPTGYAAFVTFSRSTRRVDLAGDLLWCGNSGAIRDPFDS